MKPRCTVFAVLAAILLSALQVRPVAAAQESNQPQPVKANPTGGASADKSPPEALDWAFRFASSLDCDLKDKGQAQESVVMDYASLGALDEAARRADRVEGWRRGSVYAELATLYAKSGRVEESRTLLEKAEEVKGSVTGWQGPRVSAHVAQALASLGELEETKRVTQDLSSEDRQYTGRGAAIVAAGLASHGDWSGAMRSLERLAGDSDLDVSWWRTAGYLQLAKLSSATPAQRRQALQAARRSADSIPGWMKAEALQSIAEEQRASGQKKQARESLEAAEKALAGLPPGHHLLPALQSNLARAWARAGEPRRGRAILTSALVRVELTQTIDQPAVYANIASTYRAIGDEDEALRLYEKALASAESLENARPRALAVVEICRSMARSGFPLSDPVRARLESLFGGLKDPW